MSSISPQKGEGIFQDIRKGFYDLITARRPVKRRLKEYMREQFQPPQNLLTSRQKTQRFVLKQRQRNKRITQKEKKELNFLNRLAATEARLGPHESNYERIEQRALANLKEQRPNLGKRMDVLYPTNLEEIPKELQPSKSEGFIIIKQDKRPALREENLRISNETLMEPQNVRPRETRLVNGNPMELLRENQGQALNRMFSWFYKKAFGKPTQTLHKINESEFNELQEKIFREIGSQLVRERPERDRLLEIVATRVFGAESLDVFDKEIQKEETGSEKGEEREDRREAKLIETNGVLYISDAYGSYLDRYLNWFYNDYKKFLYVTEFDQFQCWPAAEPGSTLKNHYDLVAQGRVPPLTSLKSNGCIAIVDLPEKIYQQNSSEALQNNWIAIGPDYFPQLYTDAAKFVKKDLQAKYFQKATFIQDSLDNWGILGLDPLLWRLFETKYPEIAIKMSSYIFTNFSDKIPLYFQNVKYTDNVMFFDTSVEFQKNTPDFQTQVILNPFSKVSKYYEIIKKAIEKRKLHAVSPYIAYFMKKTVPNLWKQAFEPEGKNLAVYQALNAHEKIVIDYIEFLRFMNELEDNEYNFEKAKALYEKPLSEQKTNDELYDVYLERFEDAEKRYIYVNEILFFQSLVTRQLSPEDNPRPLLAPEQIRAVLMKFREPGAEERPRESPLTAAMSRKRNTRKNAVLTLRGPARANKPLNQIARIQAQIELWKSERNSLLKNDILVNQTTKTRRNRRAVNKYYKNQIKSLGIFGRFTKSQQRRNLEIKQSVAQQRFNTLEELNQKIQNSELEVERIKGLTGLSSAAAAFEKLG